MGVVLPLRLALLMVQGLVLLKEVLRPALRYPALPRSVLCAGKRSGLLSGLEVWPPVGKR